MPRSTADIKNLGRRPRTGIDTRKMARFPSEQLTALNAWIASQLPPPGRPEAIFSIVEDRLAADA
jgi:hypothetical protein